MFLYFRSRIRVTPRFFEYKVLKLIINVKLNNFVMFLLGVQVFNPQISPLFKFTFLQVVWPNRGGGFGEIFVTFEIKTMPDIQIFSNSKYHDMQNIGMLSYKYNHRNN